MAKTDEKLKSAMNLLERAAEAFSENPPDHDWFRDLYLLTGEHMILTDEGWQPGFEKAGLVAEYGEDCIDDEVNAPVESPASSGTAPFTTEPNKTELQMGNRPCNVTEGHVGPRKWLISFSFESKRVNDRETEELLRDMTESFSESLQCRFATAHVSVEIEDYE